MPAGAAITGAERVTVEIGCRERDQRLRGRAAVKGSEMTESGLRDGYGRTAVDLRVSLTDKCNLRCSYCMPAEGLDWLPRADVLTDDEVIRLVRLAVERLGVREIRFTGGEPLLRKGLVDIVAATAALRPRPSISLTTNGLGLTRLAGPLAEAGLDRGNVSGDT